MDAEEFAEQLMLVVGDEVLTGWGGGVAAYFGGMIADVVAEANLSVKERAAFEAEAQTFIFNFGKIIRIKEDKLRNSIFEALKSALFVSSYDAGGPVARQRLDRARTERARAARKRNDIQEIVAREAKELWKRKPKFKGNSGGTANEICDAVVAAIGLLPKQPKGWVIAGVTDLERKRKLIEAIRKRISGLNRAG